MPTSDSQQIPELLEILSEAPSASKAQILVVSYTSIRYIQSSYLNAIRWTYKIDPAFFEYHCSIDWQREDGQRWRKVDIPTPLPSQIRYLQIIGNSFGYLIMLVDSIQNHQLIIILEHKCYMKEGRYMKSNFCDSSVRSQNAGSELALECVYPYIQTSLSEYAGFCNFHTWSSEGTMTDDSNVFRIVLSTSISHQKKLIYSMESLVRFLTRQGFTEDSMPVKWRDVISD
ncbi:hypothetical protein BKA64DRAFT_408057 [Cadophora sp. MPI-SDFR-AT-0126]|nr:hypothetical protein BKA64DRAFT_408057 [Leotiomycetes sp. MPI-SDFR-AT-0126]